MTKKRILYSNFIILDKRDNKFYIVPPLKVTKTFLKWLEDNPQIFIQMIEDNILKMKDEENMERKNTNLIIVDDKYGGFYLWENTNLTLEEIERFKNSTDEDYDRLLEYLRGRVDEKK